MSGYTQAWKPGDQDVVAKDDVVAPDTVAAGNDVIAGDDVVASDDVVAGGKVAADEGIDIKDAGSGIGIEASTATNTKLGTATLVGGTVTVTNSAITANSLVFLSRMVAGGTPGNLAVGTVTAGTSFVINSTSGTDTSTIAYLIVQKL